MRRGLIARRVISRAFSQTPQYTPEDTDFYRADLGNQEIFGVPRVESTRLQAAARRIAEHFMVYDAMDQALLEHGAQLDFPSGEALGKSVSVVDVDKQELGKLDRDNISDVRQYLFDSYELQRGALSVFIEDMEHIPVHGELSTSELQARLDQLLRKSEPNFLSEIASLLAVRGVPNLGMLNRMMQTLMNRGYYQPCQVVLDSLVMSRTTLNMQTLAIALSLATLAGKKAVFYSYALLAIPGEKQPKGQPEGRFGDLSVPSFELIESLSFGFAKFQDADRLDQMIRWAEEHDALSVRTLRTNMRAGLFWSDRARIKWTLQKLQQRGEVPEDIAQMAKKGLEEKSDQRTLNI